MADDTVGLLLVARRRHVVLCTVNSRINVPRAHPAAVPAALRQHNGYRKLPRRMSHVTASACAVHTQECDRGICIVPPCVVKRSDNGHKAVLASTCRSVQVLTRRSHGGVAPISCVFMGTLSQPDEPPDVLAQALVDSSSMFKDTQYATVVGRMSDVSVYNAAVKGSSSAIHAAIFTKPTDRGKQEIDFFHPAYGLQHIERKPLWEYLHPEGAHGDKTQFLRIEKAKKVSITYYNSTD
eukprot:9368-Heterococcus_DN1.PRE.4